MEQEQIGEGGTVHITKTIIAGDGSVRREMRFRTQSASRAEERSRWGLPCLSINVGSGQVRQSFYNFRSKESEKWIDRQISAPNGYISTTSPITIKKIVIKKETVNDQKPEEPSKTEARTETSTATVKIHQPAGGKTARIKINVVRSPGLAGTDNKENQMKKWL